MNNDIYNKFNGVSDEEWLELLIRANDEPFIEGVKMPGFPPLDFQMCSVAVHGPENLKTYPLDFTNTVKKYAKQCNINIDSNATLLDFGTGWGRMIRFFFKDMLSENIFGIDAWDVMINYCNELLPCGNYSLNNPLPPTAFANDSFDIIMAFSVFSHLRYDAAEKWIEEFSRILKPNGIVVATTQGTKFLSLIENLKTNPKKAEEHGWLYSLSKTFTRPIEEYRDKYDNGEFIYMPTGGGEALDSSFYGEAIVPEAFIRDIFGKYLNVVDFYDDIKIPQAIFALQKK